MLIHTERRTLNSAKVAIFLFLILDFFTLSLNFYISKKLEESAVLINLAGRQRMLSQKVVKNILLINQEENSEPAIELYKLDLEKSFYLFEETLYGFEVGNYVTDGIGKKVLIKKIIGENLENNIKQTRKIWSGYDYKIKTLLSNNGVFEVKTIKEINDGNEKILTLMNELTFLLEQQTQEEANSIRIIQLIAFLLAIINFLITVLFYSKQLKDFSKNKDILDDIINKVSVSVMILDVDSGKVLKANKSAIELFGYNNNELLTLNKNILIQESKIGKLEGVKKDGSVFDIAIDLMESDFESHSIYIATIIDVSTQKENENKLLQMAYIDSKTGLFNNSYFNKKIKEMVSWVDKENKIILLYLDLDRFKEVNDTYGHHIGDIVLHEIGNRLKFCCDEKAIISRIGGDEFTIISISNSLTEEIEINLNEKLNKILNLVKEPIYIREIEKEVFVGVSIGAYITNDKTKDELYIITKADRAMYKAKANNKGTFYIIKEIC